MIPRKANLNQQRTACLIIIVLTSVLVFSGCGKQGQILDTDRDGITDNADACDQTPVDESVDEKGCSDSQKDTDEDGVMDHIDRCGGTSLEETPDQDGCADSQKDGDEDHKR